mmetsp:Transcript_2331/g.3262  ORF Transcript_2331/g.3262 Transcript_2331/m.3262 type:complete len:84 (-) Transcript_2331:624-875(-)
MFVSLIIIILYPPCYQISTLSPFLINEFFVRTYMFCCQYDMHAIKTAISSSHTDRRFCMHPSLKQQPESQKVGFCPDALSAGY